MDLLYALRTRRSPAISSLGGPGPSEEQVEQMLTVAARVPDHGKLTPWRFVLIQGEARGRFGRVLAQVWGDQHAGMDPAGFEAGVRQWGERPLCAPLVVVVVSSPKESVKVPAWEQELSAGAVCMNLLLAAKGLGFGANWLTEWYASDGRVREELGVRVGERIAGVVYIGRVAEDRADRDRPVVKQLITNYGVGG